MEIERSHSGGLLCDTCGKYVPTTEPIYRRNGMRWKCHACMQQELEEADD